MISVRKYLVPAGCILCYIACLGDGVALYVFGKKVPGYCHVTDTISSLGAAISPVSDQVSAWWVLLGSAFAVFGLVFSEVYKERGRPARTAAWLITIYGLGEGLGSGLFKANHLPDSLTTSLIFHDALGGVGTAAVLLLPLVMRRIFPKEEHPAFHLYSGIVFCLGIAMTLLFISNHFSSSAVSFYTGLWQRVSLSNHYAYFMVVASMMLKELRLRDQRAA